MTKRGSPGYRFGDIVGLESLRLTEGETIQSMEGVSLLFRSALGFMVSIPELGSDDYKNTMECIDREMNRLDGFNSDYMLVVGSSLMETNDPQIWIFHIGKAKYRMNALREYVKGLSQIFDVNEAKMLYRKFMGTLRITSNVSIEKTENQRELLVNKILRTENEPLKEDLIQFVRTYCNHEHYKSLAAVTLNNWIVRSFLSAVDEDIIKSGEFDRIKTRKELSDKIGEKIEGRFRRYIDWNTSVEYS